MDDDDGGDDCVPIGGILARKPKVREEILL
jgi:hypothetical protein